MSQTEAEYTTNGRVKQIAVKVTYTSLGNSARDVSQSQC